MKITLVYIVFLQIISAAETLTLHPSSKIAKENLDVFCEAWESQISDMSTLLREINDVFEGKRGETVHILKYIYFIVTLLVFQFHTSDAK